MQHRQLGWIGSAIVLGLGGSAQAQTTIYDTFDAGGGYAIPSWTVDPYQSIATEFSVSSAANLSSISLALIPGTYSLFLTTDGIGQPGTVLDSWAATTPGGVVTLTPNGMDALAPGNYYVEAVSGGEGGWYQNDVPYNAPFLFTAFGSWNTFDGLTGVMDVQVTPEPAPIAILGLGALGLLLRRRR